MTQIEKKQVEIITIRQLFGAGLEVRAGSWERADEIIRSSNCPGSVDTILDFGSHKIEYTYDMPNPLVPLRTAVRQWVEYMAGLTKPFWMDDEEWQDFKLGQEEYASTYRDWLEILDI